ncbi:MAG: divergent polysaccharide deacetylase family protein [Ectothiorhodospiraceae bacterium]|jgi:hypothetical protein
MSRRLAALALLVVAACAAPAWAAPPPRLAVIIDDVGNNLAEGLLAASLPAPATLAILPRTPYAVRLARAAHRAGKQVMLHQPMQSMDGEAPGPGAITLHMTRHTVLSTLRRNIASIPYVAGVNNHMGSLVTRHPGHMTWVMDELRREGGLFFVDSRTDYRTVAELVAREEGVPVARRDVFLDNDLSPRAIAEQLHRAAQQARGQGYAIAIGHPHPQTLEVLKEQLPRLADAGIQLVPASRIVELERNDRQEVPLWHASLSPSPKAAKSSKP